MSELEQLRKEVKELRQKLVKLEAENRSQPSKSVFKVGPNAKWTEAAKPGSVPWTIICEGSETFRSTRGPAD